MCKHTHYYYPKCGHIAKWTVESCVEFTNKLHANPDNEEKMLCIETIDEEVILPVSHPHYCLKCEQDWLKEYDINYENHGDQADNHSVQSSRGRTPNAPNRVLELKAKMNSSLSDGNSSPVHSQYSFHDMCVVGMVLVPEHGAPFADPAEDGFDPSLSNLGLDVRDDRSHGTTVHLNGPNGAQSDTDYLNPWNIARFVRGLGGTREKAVPDSPAGPLSSLRPDPRQGTFYDSSSSPDAPSIAPSSSLDSPMTGFEWSPPVGLARSLWPDATQPSASAPTSHGDNQGVIEMARFLDSDGSASISCDSPYAKITFETDTGYDADSGNEESERGARDADMESIGSLSCNASSTELVYHSDGESDNKSVVVVSSPDINNYSLNRSASDATPESFYSESESQIEGDPSATKLNSSLVFWFLVCLTLH
ncbi:hypothetical protein MAP00_001014 [Monascus purpureus]|nr:hypothetical protein MAP00_001014 [Monascus purpureus]